MHDEEDAAGGSSPAGDPIEVLLEPLLSLPPAEHAAALDRLCADHPPLAERLRRRHATFRELLGKTTMPPTSGAALRPPQIGPYKILDLLGEGGMGSVYLAEQSQPVKRRVALKLIKLGMDSKAVVARFEQERQALALMQHDGIAKVFDCGTSERGQPYFVMELVKGVPLTEFCEQNKLSLPDRLLLLRQVCAAVQHAHQKGVVHRDLKPGNVLVSDEGGKLQIKIIDFGLAKAMGQKLVEATLFTEAGQVVGTPEYMAPEQAEPSNADIDTRADVYSLGVMLYEVLVGALPFTGAELRRAGLLEMQRVLREVDPPRPSTKLSSMAGSSAAIAATRRMSATALQKALRSDLDWVVLKALEKDRNRRYETANALSGDLQRFLDHEPLVAGPPSATYRMKKLARRYRRQIVAAALVMATAVAGAVVAIDYAITAEENAERAAKNERLANTRAEENARLAAAEAKIKEDLAGKVSEFQQLAGVTYLADTIAEEEQLHPAWPHKIRDMQSWLRRVEGLLAMQPVLEETLVKLELRRRESALEDSARRGQSNPSSPHWIPLAEALTGDPDSRRQATQQQAYQASVESSRFLRETLRKLQADLETLANNQKRDVERRLKWAVQVADLTHAHPNARHTWTAVRAAIASHPKYAGQSIDLRDEDVMGLVPIGENPVTKLWEFYELRSAWDAAQNPRAIVIPEHRVDGSIEVTAETGIVLVLLPGGTFRMGAQDRDEHGANFDPAAQNDEVPVHEVTLAPFFLARHELTRAQWQRLVGTRPFWWQEGNRYDADPIAIGPSHPADSIDADEALLWMERSGLSLPTEAQWEYGCRAGTTTPWWPGAEVEDLEGCANVHDRTSAQRQPQWGESSPITDGFTGPAPVGCFRANAFGLHDTHGNLREWCRDRHCDYDVRPRPGDGYRVTEPSSGYQVDRGGGCGTPSLLTRSAFRSGVASSSRNSGLGLRAARALRAAP